MSPFNPSFHPDRVPLPVNSPLGTVDRREAIEMGFQFVCQQCGKILGPERNLGEKVYKGHSLCVMCRKASGQQNFTQEERMALFAEEALEGAGRKQ